MTTSDGRIDYWQCPLCRREFRNRVWPIRCCSLAAAPKLAVTLEPRLLSVADLHAFTVELIAQLPPIRRVVGIARSGMLPASIIATHLGCELWSIEQHSGQLLHLGTGVRMQDVELGPGSDLLIDDSAFSGRAMRACTEHLRRHGWDPLRAVVIAQPDLAAGTVDFYARSTLPHVFEWNLCHAPWVGIIAWDIDGVLCRDFTAEEDDDGDRYLAAMMSMQPTQWRSKKPLHLVTARLERYRAATLAWLEKIGQPVASLTMGPWSSRDDRERDDVAAWKATVMEDRGLYDLLDSSDYIARRVNELTGRQTISTDSRRVYVPRQKPADVLTRSIPCENRGPLIDHVSCSGCWSRGAQVTVPVFECGVHGRCHTLRVHELRSKVGQGCFACEDRIDACNRPLGSAD